MMAEARRHHGRQASSLCADAPRHHHLTSRIGITSGTTRDAPRDRGRGSASRRADCSQARRRVAAARARVCTGAPTRCAIAERSRGAAPFAVGARRLFAVSVARPARSWRAIRARNMRAHRPRSGGLACSGCEVGDRDPCPFGAARLPSECGRMRPTLRGESTEQSAARSCGLRLRRVERAVCVRVRSCPCEGKGLAQGSKGQGGSSKGDYFGGDINRTFGGHLGDIFGFCVLQGIRAKAGPAIRWGYPESFNSSRWRSNKSNVRPLPLCLAASEP